VDEEQRWRISQRRTRDASGLNPSAYCLASQGAEGRSAALRACLIRRSRAGRPPFPLTWRLFGGTIPA